MKRFLHPGATWLALLALPAAVPAHVVLPPGGAAAGSTYSAAFKVGHACKGAQSTTALTVRLPAGFKLVSAQPRPGWTLATKADEVSWTAATPEAALPTGTPDSFVVTGKLTDKPGTLWFKTVQACDVGSADWAAIPDPGAPKPEFPAPHVDVLAAGVAAVEVRDAWMRSTVQGQPATGLYARLAAPAGARLVGVSTPIGEAAVHEMKMDGDVMRMRELADGLDVPPGRTVDLAPSGYHVMVTGLKQPLAVGAAVPVTLHFVDREGRRGDLALQVPVQAAAASSTDDHRHAH